MASLKYWLWLSSLPKVSLRMKHVLLDAFETPEKIYFSESGEYSLVEGITRPVIAALEEGRSLDGADRILGDCERLGLRVLTIQDTEYPDRLRNICDPPLLLYVQGRMPLFDDEVAVAMVGTRRTSPSAAEMGEKLAYQMAGLGAVIVSGLAAGGDASAHRGALRAGGLTVGVIAGGHDIVYPRENRWLYQDIGVRGAILSEYPPGTDHRAGHFPERNRIISGLSLGVVVIEAPERSGALRRTTGTARAATSCCGTARSPPWTPGTCSATTPPAIPTGSAPCAWRSPAASSGTRPPDGRRGKRRRRSPRCPCWISPGIMASPMISCASSGPCGSARSRWTSSSRKPRSPRGGFSPR